MTASVDPRGWITRFEYDARGQRTALTSPSGAVTRYRYDPAGQQTEVIDPNGSPTRFSYGATGRITEVTDARGGVTRYEYDAAGRQTAQTDPLGRTTRRAYDGTGNLITVTDPSGHAEHFSYDGNKRLTSHLADDGSQVSFTYDQAGRRASMTDATGTTHYAYDGAGRMTAVTAPDGGVLAVTYDAAGQRTSMTYSDGHQVSYDYDLSGRLTGLHDSRAGDAAYALDPDGRLLTEQLPGRYARRYHYDHGVMRRFSVIYDGHAVAKKRFTHDPDGRIATTREGDLVTRYHYDPAGQLIDIEHYRAGDRAAGPGQRPRPRPEDRDIRPETHLTYDVTGNRTSLHHGGHEIRYEYDLASQLLHAETEGRRTEFRYDPAGRLVEEREGERVRETIRYDGFGQPTAITRDLPDLREHLNQVFNGDGLLSSVRLAAEERGHHVPVRQVRPVPLCRGRTSRGLRDPQRGQGLGLSPGRGLRQPAAARPGARSRHRGDRRRRVRRL